MNIWQLGILLFAFSSSVALGEKLSLRADTWYPMNGDPTAAHPGYMIEIAKATLEPAGYEIDYDTMPWKRALDDVRAGKFDCVVGAYREDAPDFMFPDEPLGIDLQTFYVKSDNAWKYNDIGSLKLIKLGIVGGYGYGEPLGSYLADPANASNIQAVNADNALEQNIKKLMAGRIDALVESNLVMSAKLKDLGLADTLKDAGSMAERSNMYIACTPMKENSKKIVQLISNGVIELRKNGKLAQILNAYGLNDWK